ncbi:MAG: cyclic nucleotide-binding domain-containing protein [Desulfobacterales bacterium]|nr:cyclic nucleotide-binding domain-containing protein [Desulfobacterales bacterium]MDD4072969.1 cyclic nucleotide-binding domain-containing protein [Desulfobacterales bacterium]MDD4392278.1 cyclic nucleotide-binding domain-containing protein [Desulfobacterales bacterium]
MLDKKLLTEINLFSRLPMDRLERIAQESEIVHFKKDELVFSQDGAAINLYGVLDGEVELSLNFKDMVLKADIRYEETNFSRFEYMERPIVVEVVGAGEIFGWSSVMSAARETTTARCSKASRIVSVPAAYLKAMFHNDPSLGFIVMSGISEIISRRLRTRTDKLVEAWGQAFGTTEI